MWWVALVDVAAVLVGLALLALAAWRLVVRPGLALGRAVAEVGGQARSAAEALAAATGAAPAAPPAEPPVTIPGPDRRRTLSATRTSTKGL